MTDTKIIDIDLADSVKSDVIFNTDVVVASPALKSKILTTSDNCLMRTVTLIGSKKKITEADVIDESYLKRNLVSS